MTNPAANVEERLSRLGAAAPARLVPAVELGIGLVDGYALYDSPLGKVAVTFNPDGVTSVDLAAGDFAQRFLDRFGRRARAALPPPAWQMAIGRALEQGRPGRLPIDFGALTEFQQKVLTIAATIPRGQVRPYAWLAAESGRPKAARAVGSTMARNPVPLIVPCHRVVRSDGRIGEYSLGGPTNKQSLLRAEGVDPRFLEALATAGYRYLGSDTTGIFCLPTCSSARRITPSHLHRFTDKESAESMGFRACRQCRP
jgi:O-6-methylguanine DNA methyltransferase